LSDISSIDGDKPIFTKDFNKQEPIPEEGIQRALELLNSGRLHRYNTAPGEISDVALLEKEFADYVGTRYCAAFSPCGSSLYVALKCAGVQSGDSVLTNAFTLAPVPAAILYSGSYMLYDKHISKPPLAIFERHKKLTPNLSLRMSNLQAAVLRPQLRILDRLVDRWNDRYAVLEKGLNHTGAITIPKRRPKENYVGSSIQFSLEGLSYDCMQKFVSECDQRGVRIKWFGRHEPEGYTSTYESWQYFSGIPELPQTKHVLEHMCDMRFPLTFTNQDCETLSLIVCEVIGEITRQA
jgi:dTDP-4-amino-4,6-dideoxygalactose transaminase